MPNVPDDDDDDDDEEAYHPSDPGSPSDDAPSLSASDGSNDNSSNDGSGDEDAGGDAAAGEDAGDGGNPQAITATQLQRAMLKEQRETNRLNRLLANLHMHHLVLPPPGSTRCRPGCLTRTPARRSGRPSSICARATRSRLRPLSARRAPYLLKRSAERQRGAGYKLYKKESMIIAQTSHHTRHENVISRPVMITKGRDITGVNITAYA